VLRLFGLERDDHTQGRPAPAAGFCGQADRDRSACRMNMRCGTTTTAHALLGFDALVLASVTDDHRQDIVPQRNPPKRRRDASPPDCSVNVEPQPS